MKRELSQLITAYVKSYKNLKQTLTDWRDPLIGFAHAADPLFLKLREIVSPDHLLPADIVPNAKSVITFFIPFTGKTVKSNIGGEETSKEWDYAYIETNILINDLCKYLHETLTARGFNASLLPATYNYNEKKLISDWSHRSAAYISGIGKFGLHNMLITESGCCGRLGSVITDAALTPTPRTDEEYCLYKFNGTCKKCIDRCVNDAFQPEDGEISCNRWKCNEQIFSKKSNREYPIGLGDTCGKCMCGVPCSLVNPRQAGQT